MGKRAKLQKLVKSHIRDLNKRGIDVETVTGGKSIEKLAWNQKSYDNFMEEKRIALSRQRKIKQRTNKNGYVFIQKDFNRVKKLQDEYNKKVTSEYNKYKNKFGKPDRTLDRFLKGETVRHLNSGENVQLGESFRKVNLLDRFIEGMDIDSFIKMTKERMNDFSMNDVIDDRSKEMNDLYFKSWKEQGKLTTNRIKELTSIYKDMDIIQRSQFNKDMKRTMAWVDSESRNPKSHIDVYYTLKDVMEKQLQRVFIPS